MRGIRLKLTAALMLLMLIPLIGTQRWMNWRLDNHYTQVEVQAIASEMQRLLVAFDAQLLQHDTLVNDWANWTDFADYVRTGRGDFAQSNLTPLVIDAAGFSWLAVLRLDGRIQHSVSAADIQPQQVLNSPYGPLLRTAPAPGKPSCGLGQWQKQWVALCRQGIRSSTGMGAPVGMLLVGQPLSPDFIPHLRRVTGLNFQLFDSAAPDHTDLRSGTEVHSSALGQTSYRYQIEPEHIRVWWPVHDMAGQVVGHLELDWPRTTYLRAREALGSLQWQALGLFLLITVGLWVLLDRLVVRRLLQLRQGLRQIHDSERWQDRIEIAGKDEITDLAQDTNDLLTRIEFQVVNLELMAESDAMTGLPNRRSFDRVLKRAVPTHLRYQRPLCLAVLDVDHFKLYNDHYGHAQGDVALKTVAQCLLAQAQRPGDLPARVGGEEFAVVLEDTTLEGGQVWLRKVQQRLDALNLEHSQSPVANHLTLSAGLALAQPGDTAQALYERADAALYQAKTQGRNRVVCIPSA